MMSAWEADGSSMSGCMTTWDSENDGSSRDMLEDVFYALDRLGRSDDGKSGLGRSAISV